ncbi:MAG: hypothetical protein GVY26_17810 [Bacteroidetes bacterium]|jgi:hypothetical protein|nr:hypothetical protein [Bacteroidota bacterium]
MKSIKVNITDQDFSDLGLESGMKPIEFRELVKKIKVKIAKDAMLKSLALAKEARLSELTIKEIDAEIEAVRKRRNP